MREHADEPIAFPVDELREVRPPVDRVRMEAVRERSERSLFGSAPPAQLGRYVLLGQSADGGMGVVYAAYDPGLHRKVALKVLHPRRQWDERAHERLIVEARALAKLDHPNVVKVHDVITQDDQVVIVMEWVEGTTLAAWERERSRSWRDVMAVYSQAGQGLAAAHGVGVIHRDFKPANAIVGDDGRVRVLDFGLARHSGPDAGLASPSVLLSGAAPGDDTWATSLTGTGDMVGTLAYASPEQIAGAVATPASDQFSFGVSLHRALEGVAPFAGEDAEALARSIRAERIMYAPDARTIPKWLRATVARALAVDPATRFPSMAVLLAELARPRGWRRWRVPLVVGVCVIVAALALVIRPGTSDPLADCDGGIAEARAVWNDARRAQVQAALAAIATPYVVGIRDRVMRGIDDYRDRWLTLHRDACVAHRRGDQSAALLDRRMLCMQRHLGDLRATVAVLAQVNAASSTKTVDLVARIPDVTECADIERLQAETAPPTGTAQRNAVDAVRARISHAMALDRAGQSVEALAIAATAIEEAERSGYPPVVADGALIHGRILLARREYKAAVASFSRARAIALAQRQFSTAVEAAARELYAEGMENADVKAAERDAAMFLPLSQGLSGDHFARPLLLNNLGTVYMAAGDRAEATRYFQEAHRALVGVAAPDLELTIIDRNLAMVTANTDQRDALARGVWQRLRAEIGDAHLATLDALGTYARYVPEPSKAFPLLSQACRTYSELHPELVEERVFCESYRAFLAGELGDTAQELHLYEDIVRIAAGSTSDDVVPRAALASAYANLLRGDGKAAVVEFDQVARIDAGSRHWWTRARAADAELGLGLAKHLLGQEPDAERHLKTALEIYQGVIPMNEEAEFRQKLALTERTLIAVRRNLAPDPLRSRRQ